jgi:hypothetical protein
MRIVGLLPLAILQNADSRFQPTVIQSLPKANGRRCKHFPTLFIKETDMYKLIAAVAVVAAFSAPALASENSCTATPQSQWMSKNDIKTKYTKMGYEVRQIKVENNCYEIYAMKNGERFSAALNPVDGKVVGGPDSDD